MAKRLCESILSGWGVLAISAWLCLVIPAAAEAAVGRTGGSFSVSSNGAATYSIPIFTPPGPRGLQPSVALTYSSNTGIGYLGKGWGLEFSSISRCKKTVAQDGGASPVSLSVDDGYCLDGNRLRVQSGTYGTAGSVYYTEIADFSRITAGGTVGNGPESWTVERKDGLIYTYGGTSDSRVLAYYFASPVWQSVTTWMVSEIRDRAGNKVKFTWKTANSTTYGTTHPVKIEWTQTSAGSGSYVNSMDFHYSANGNAPASTPMNYRWGSMKDADLLTSITVSVGGTVKRNYLLAYENSPTTTVKRLTQVTECSDSGASDCLSPTTLSYQDGATGVNTSSPLLSLSGDISAADGSFDFDGNGIRDIAYNLSGTWYVRLGSVASGYGSAINTGVTTPTLIAGKLLGNHKDQLLGEYDGIWHVYSLSGSSFTPTSTGIAWTNDVVVADVDADGLDDVVYLSAAGVVANSAYLITPDWLPLYVHYNTTSGGSLSFSEPDTYPLDTFPFDPVYGPLIWTSYSAWPWEGQVVFPELGLGFATWIGGATLSKGGDANGDGRADLNLKVNMQGCNFIVSYGYDPLYCTEAILPEWRYAFTGYYVVHFSGSGSTLAASLANLTSEFGTASTLVDADYNGDACDDFLLGDVLTGAVAGLSTCTDSGIAYSSGSLWWSSIGAADWNGDGNEDIFQWSGSTLYVRSVVAGALTAPVSTGIPDTYGCWQILRTDGNGDGMDDIGCLWPGVGLTIYPHNGTNTAPDLLASVVDGFGVTHTPTYTAIERSNYVAYDDADYPSRDLTRGRVVVKKVTASDGIGGTFDTDYTYFGAQVNLQGRGFAGFEKIQAVDSRNGVMREQHFKREFPYSGMPYEVDVYQSASGPLISKRTITAASATLDATAYNQRYFPYIAAISEAGYEVGGTANGLQIFGATTTNTYGDDWGNLTASTRVVTDMDASSPQYGETWTTATTQTISPSTTYWCLGLPSAATVTRSSTVSGETTVYQSKGYSPDYVNCRQDAESVGSGALQVDTNYSYGDAFGNITSVSVTGRNPNASSMGARTASISWGTTGQFPESETNALSQTTTRTFHSTFGALLTETDPNSIVVANNEYDAFGRVTRTTRADATSTSYTLYDCEVQGWCWDADPTGSDTSRDKTVMVVTELDSSNNPIRSNWIHSDHFDRPIVNHSQLSTGSYSQASRQYDNQGRVYRETPPTDQYSGLAYWTTNTYDLAGRVITQSRPQSQSVSTPVTTAFTYAGRTQTVTDPQGKVTTKILDVNGGMRRSQDHDGYYQNFAYDAGGNLKTVTDALSNTLFSAGYVYGIKPFQTVTTDMDLGSWSYTYNSLGELVEWQDAKSQTFSQTYDELSRVTSRTEAEGTTTFTFGTSAGSHNIGQLAGVSMSGYSETLSYDSVGRPSTRSITTDQSYDIDYAYTSQGSIDTVTYPQSTASTRVKVKYGYAYGILQSVTDWTSGSAGVVYWTANTQNALGQTTQETLGNGVVTNKSFDAVTGWLSSIQSAVGGGTALQNQSYLYDLIGNVTQRQESTQGLTENFYYDNLYRLDHSTLNSTTNLALTYDAMGNITNRTDVNGNATWAYHSTRKHAVANTGSGGASYSYDANGNMTSRAGSSISWSSFNYPTQLATATETTEFFYGPDRQYYKQVYTGPSSTETTHYIGGVLEKVSDGTTTDWRHTISAGGQVVAIVSRKSDSTNAVHYPLQDPQGSGSTLTDSSGTNLVRQSYTAFGLPRDGADWDGPVSSGDKATINGISRRGYTGHSMLGDMGLIHMNGRVQDAITGRFLSPDPTVPHPGYTQSYNRYAYVRNNPMSFVDPSGFMDISATGWSGASISRDEVVYRLEACTGYEDQSESSAGCSYWAPYWAMVLNINDGIQFNNDSMDRMTAELQEMSGEFTAMWRYALECDRFRALLTGEGPQGGVIKVASQSSNKPMYNLAVEAKLTEVFKVGYSTNKGLKADFDNKLGFKVSLGKDGKATVSQGQGNWDVVLDSGGGGGGKLSADLKVVALQLSARATGNGNLVLSGKATINRGPFGFSAGGEIEIPIKDWAYNTDAFGLGDTLHKIDDKFKYLNDI